MKIAALYDIHANLPALTAVLEEVRTERVDQIVIGGDVVPGPMPQETLDCLLDLDIPTHFIHGNGDLAVLQHLGGKIPTGVPEHYRPLVAWNAEQLTKDQQSALDSWPRGLNRKMHALGDVLFCHATPRNATEIFTRLTPEAHLLSTAFMGIDANLVICGHTHMQFDRTVGKIRVVNAGSVGMAFGEPGAYWLVLENDVELRHTGYDLEEAARIIRDTSYPQAQEFAQRNILNPPSEAEMLEAFGRAELK